MRPVYRTETRKRSLDRHCDERLRVALYPCGLTEKRLGPKGMFSAMHDRAKLQFRTVKMQ